MIRSNSVDNKLATLGQRIKLRLLQLNYLKTFKNNVSGRCNYKITSENLPGARRSPFMAFNLSTSASSFCLDLPATAHFRFVGKFLVMYSATMVAVYPFAPRSTISYSQRVGLIINNYQQ